MNILVTGAAGFIGSVVTEVLCDHGHEVTAWDNLINGHRDAIDGRARFECIDLLDAAKVHAGLRILCPDAVVHLAAEALIDESMRDPGRFYRANLVGGIHLLDAMIASGMQAAGILLYGSRLWSTGSCADYRRDGRQSLQQLWRIQVGL